MSKEGAEIFTIRENDKIVSFAALNYEESPPLFTGTELESKPSYFFSIAGTHPDFSRSGHYTELTRQRLMGVVSRFELNKHLGRKNYFHTVTQNPRIYHTLVKSLDELKQQGTIADYRLSLKHPLKGFFRGESLTKETQKSSNPEAEKLFEGINPADGDAFVLAWELIPPASL